MSRRSNKWTVGIVAFGLAVAAGRVFSDDTARAKPSKEEMKKMMEEAARPAPEHEKLALDAGTWDADMTMWMDPKGPAETAKGLNVAKSTLGGLWLDEEFSGTFDGKPFTGRTIVGFDKSKQKYFGLWISSGGSSPEVVWGTANAAGDVITFEGEPVSCPMGLFTPKWVVRRTDADHYTFEHWAKMQGAADFEKGLEIKYTRRK
jgi:hypothetical protein